MFKRQFYDIVLVLLIILENLFLFCFYQKGITDQATNSTGFFVTSVLIGLIVLIKFYNVSETAPGKEPLMKRKYLMVLPGICCLFYLNLITIPLFKAFDFAKLSDIIPTIQILSKRFLSGQYPYAPEAYEWLGHVGPPSYLPMHWLPFTFAEFFHFDYRTISFTIWCIGAFVVFIRTIRSDQLWIQILVPLLMFFSYWLIIIQYSSVIAGTVEIMIAGYYMLLIVGLDQKNVFITGFCIAACILSRYYIVLWLPLWMFVLLVSGNRKKLFRIGMVILFFITFLYVIPFLSKDWSYLYASPATYSNRAIGEWYRLNEKGLPAHLYSGTGFAYLFYNKYQPANLMAGYIILKKTLFISLLSVIFIMGIWYWFNRKKINKEIFLLASFKIYLSVFLAFIVVPYSYLMVTSTFVSIAVFAEQSRYKLKRDVNQP